MLKLKNVSKFYYNKGVIASGFTKVSADFEIGEFVVITGESGSGKSTLLNVISGLDSYEEGEMYINGEETSHYGEADFEEYRKKYVSNIFQNFNLVNSYTVYQNVELVLLLNGYKKKEVKKKVLDLINKVNLGKYKNTKVSKLSGGQKQRVAIARALARETPIIVCDEPTANLDSKSSKEIIRILKEISKNKLLIMVTHDYPSVESVATRVVKMHDGKIISDKKKDNVENDGVVDVVDNIKGVGIRNIISLGVRNTFNIFPKFILMFIVFFFVVSSISLEYGSLRKSEYESSKLGFNWWFNDTTDTRIIINKKDRSSITKEDFDKINKLSNISHVVENDIMLDEFLWLDSMDNEGFYVNGMLRSIDEFNLELDYGRMPENENEVVYFVNDYEYYFKDRLEDAVKKIYYLNGDKGSLALKVVGVKYIGYDMFMSESNTIYGTQELLDNYMSLVNRNYSKMKIKINNQNYDGYYHSGYEFSIVPSDKVKKGNAVVSENIGYTCKDYDCKNKKINVSISNLYYEDSLELKISNVYNDKNVKSVLGINKNDSSYGSIFINREEYDSLFNKDSYQASVFASRVDYVEGVAEALEDMGYMTLQMKKSLNNEGETAAKVISIVKLVITFILVVALFFISYFVIKLILKSRNVYFSTLRILGARLSNVKKILDVELFVISNLAYFTYILFVLLVKRDIISVSFVKSASEYLNMFDYVLLYGIITLMSYLISSRFVSKLFKKSAMKSYREEV